MTDTFRALLLKSPVPVLAGITVLAVMVHGYHLGADDAAIYVPAVKRVADPALYPFGAEFFLTHARLSAFSEVVGLPARLMHLPADSAIFIWHIASIFLLLLAGWQLLGGCFTSGAARWSGVALLAAALSVPVAGTGLAIMDPYLTARSLSTPATLFAVACYVSGRWRRALLWLAAAAAIHPQMAVYAVVFLGCMLWMRRGEAVQTAEAPAFGMLAALPFGLNFSRVTGAARECLLSRTYFFVSNWAWYEWAGVLAPLALLRWMRDANPRRTLPGFRLLAGGLVPFGVIFTVGAIGLGIPTSLESYNRLQPMRGFHLLYIVFFLLLGGLLGEYVLQRRAWRWAAVFLPLAVLMAAVQADAYASSPHVEWPGIRERNPWMSAFLWIRDYTPKNAVFALDPNYMARPGEDAHGFRAVAERSVLADAVKDSGAVSLFPGLATDWAKQVAAARGINHFGPADFVRLEREFPVTWILTRRPAPAGLVCPYKDGGLAVCRL